MHWLNRYRVLILAAICLLCTSLILVVRLLPSIPFVSAVWSGEQSFEDLMQREGRKTETRGEFVFLGIDQSTMQFTPYDAEQLKDSRALQLMTERPFPWSREVWAILLDKLFASGARLVMFDLIFNPPNDGDAAFHGALERHRDKVVLGANFDFAAVQEQGGAAQLVLPNTTLIPSPQIEDDRVGYVVFFADPLDQKIRTVRYTVTDLQL
ncbi:MAG: CHASE2 domain-containing protein, partial [Chthoniobacterales bacterium]